MNQPPSNSRRGFLQKASLYAISIPALPAILTASNHHLKRERIPPKNARILFQGDSITDARRKRDHYYPNDAQGMGNGYVMHAVTQLLGTTPDKQYVCYNRGISGNKVYQLADRWEDDCLQLRPDVLSILIGVNDYWHTAEHGYAGTVVTYDQDLRKLLDRTKKELPDVQLMIGEPFYVPGGTAIDEDWKEGLAPYREKAKQIAKDYNAVFIPYHSVFAEALKKAPVEYWCPDGVHPSLAGAYLMAQAWMEGFKKL